MTTGSAGRDAASVWRFHRFTDPRPPRDRLLFNLDTPWLLFAFQVGRPWWRSKLSVWRVSDA